MRPNRRFLGKQKGILRNQERLFSRKYQVKIISLTFLTGVIIWEIQVFLWSPIFRKQSFPVLHMFFKCRFWTIGDSFLKTKRGFSSEHSYWQKPPLFLKNTSWIQIYKLYSKTYFWEKTGKICKDVLNMKGEINTSRLLVWVDLWF